MPFEKGHSGFKPKGTKHKETLLKEERRAIFEAEVSKTWLKTIKKLPPTYLADQFMGKAPDEVNVSIKKNESLPEDKIEQINEIMLKDD